MHSYVKIRHKIIMQLKILHSHTLEFTVAARPTTMRDAASRQYFPAMVQDEKPWNRD